MDEEAGFLQAIIEQPDDEIHRLVYADWLEEHGQSEHAHLIRHQCGLQPLMRPRQHPFERIGRLLVPDLSATLRRRLEEPFRQIVYGASEEDETPSENSYLDCVLIVRGGLVEQLELRGSRSVQAFIRHAASLSGRVPLFDLLVSSAYHHHGVVTTHPRTSLASLLRLPLVRTLRTLDLTEFELLGPGVALLLNAAQHLSTVNIRVRGRSLQSVENMEQLTARFDSRLTVVPPVPSVPGDIDDIPF